MSQERYGRIKEVVLGALEHTGPERAAYLARECSGDPELRREVESLLSQNNTPSILDTGGYGPEGHPRTGDVDQ